MRIFLAVVVGAVLAVVRVRHDAFGDLFIGSNDGQIRIQRSNFFEQGFLERYTDGEQKVRFAQAGELAGGGFVGVGGLSFTDQGPDFHFITGKFPQKPGLRRNTDKNQRF